ncbi:MAG: AI-2E family transporter [Phycisphaerales bacterium]
MADPLSNEPVTTGPGSPGPARRPSGLRGEWARMHLWQIQPVRDLLILVAILGILYLGKVLSLVTVPLLLALLLAYLFEPLVQRILKVRWISRQGAAVAIIFSAVLVVVVPVILGSGFAVVQGASVVQRVGANATLVVDVVQSRGDPSARAALPIESWRSLADWLVRVREQAERASARRRDKTTTTPSPPDPSGSAPERKLALPAFTPGGMTSSDAAAVEIYRAFEWSVSWLKENSQTIGQRALNTGAGALEWMARSVLSFGFIIFGAFLTAFFFYFFCTGYGRVIGFWESLIPERRKGPVIDMLLKMDIVISGFIRGRLIICAILIVYYTIAYWLIGVPAPLLLGPVIGLLALVPFAASIGLPIAITLLYFSPTPLAAFQNEWWWAILGPLLVSAISQVLDDYVLSPAIQGRATGMDTPTILFASLAGGVLAGFYGLLIAIPVAACVKIVVREVVWPRFKSWAEGHAKDPLPISNK